MSTVGFIFRKRRTVGLGLVAVLLATMGCAANYGSFALDPDVAHTFQTGAIQPGYRYYYAGRDDMPYAIMAVDRRYRVPSRYWIAFTPTPQQLEDMSGNIYGKNRHDPYGAQIRAADGEVIGFWYSNVRFRSVTVDKDAMTVQVLFTNPENDDAMSVVDFE